MQSIYTPADLREYLSQHQIQAQLLPDIGHTPTVRAAASILQVDPDQIVKTLFFVVQSTDMATDLSAASLIGEAGGVIVISHGERRVDTKRLAQHADVAARIVRLARPDVVAARLGYPAGGVPPFGHRTAYPVLLEKSLLTTQQKFGDRIYAGGGDDRTMLQTTVSELIRVLTPEIVVLST